VFDIQGNLVSHTITLRPAFNLLVLTLLHYRRCSKIVCMFELEVTWSISEIAHFLELFSNHMFILGRINRIEKCSEASSWRDTKIRRRQNIASDNLIFGSISGGNCLLPPKIARTVYLVMRRLSNVGEAVHPKRRKKSAVRKTDYQNILQFVQLYLNFNSIIFACSLSKNCLKNNYFPHVWLALE
jgi:hypothetical protein